MSTVSIIAIGDELLLGQTINSNAAWLGDELASIGWRVMRVVTIGDDRQQIADVIRDETMRSNVVITSGGLGPTHDDVTRAAICDLLGCELEDDLAQLHLIRERFRARGIEPNERSLLQARVPSACVRLPNHHGSAPGLKFAVGDATVYVLPGVPSELRGITNDSILPALADRGGYLDRRTFLVVGVAESVLADALAETEPLLDVNVTLAYLPSTEGVRVRVMLLSEDPDAEQRFINLVAMIRTLAAEWIVSDCDEPLAGAVGREFTRRGMTLGTAESCTGGGIGEAITAIPGASTWYCGGVIVYSNVLKTVLLGVPPELIEEHGAVSDKVAAAMAVGAMRCIGSDVAVAVTGVAGPDGGTDQKPVGTVFIAVASSRGVDVRDYRFSGGRAEIRERTVTAALDLIGRSIRDVSTEIHQH